MVFDYGPCDWLVLPLLCPTPTIQFSLDHKRRRRKRNRKKLLTTLIFDFHQVVSTLMTPTTISTTIPSLKPAFSYRRWTIYWALIKHQALLTIQAKVKRDLQLLIFVQLLRYTLVKSSQACGKRRETLKSYNWRNLQCMRWRNCRFSHDVTKFHTTKLLILLIFYFNEVYEQLKTNIQTNFCSEWVLGFAIGYA